MSENTLKTWRASGGFDSRTPTWTHWGSQGGPKPPAASTDALKIQFVVYNSLYNKLWILRRKRYNMHFRYSDVNQQSFVNKRNTVGTKTIILKNPVTSCLGRPMCVILKKYRFFICHYLWKKFIPDRNLTSALVVSSFSRCRVQFIVSIGVETTRLDFKVLDECSY